MSEKNEQGTWEKWESRWRAGYNSEQEIYVGETRLGSIRRDCARFDIRNASGGILLNCLIDTHYESGESGGSPSYPVTWLTLEATTPDGWKIKLDDKVELRRVPESVAQEAQLNEADRLAKLERERLDLERRQSDLQRELADVNQKLGSQG